MRVTELDIKGVILTEPKVYGDDRGFFIESYRREWFPKGREMIQGNRGDRKAGAIVGFHYHLHQADFWYVPFGTCQVILHDLRKGSFTEGKTISIMLGYEKDDPTKTKHHGLYIPPGIAHGFSAITDMTITYLVDGYYNTADELGVAWDDPDIAAPWKLKDPIVSERDKTNPLKKDIPIEFMPHNKLRG